MKRYCPEPGCPNLVTRGRCPQHKRTQEARRPYPQTRAWYQSARWQAIRRRHLSLYPLCAHCLEQKRPVPATDVDHVLPHRGDAHIFWHGALQSLCHGCHSRKTRAEQQGNHG